MFRAGLEPDSPHVRIYLTGGEGICMQYRPETGTYSHHMGCKYSGAKAAWLKLEKRMDFITGYVGTDGGSGNISWTELYSTEAAYIEDSQYNADLAVCPSYHYQMEAIFEDYDYSVESYFFPSAAPSISSAPSAFSDESIDIGSVGIAGSVMKTSAGNFKATGSGNIWGRSDYFHYDHHPVHGDLSIEMLVDSFEGDQYWRKAGLMIRDTLEPNAKHYSLFMMGDGNRMGQFFRSCVNCYTGWNDQPRIYDRSVYMKITKTGNTFEAFYRKVGSDEDAWAKIGETKVIDFSNDYFYVGIAVSADTNGKTATISGSGFTITGDMYYFPSAAPSISAAPSAYITSQDIGNVGKAGSATKSGDGQVTVRGSGYDIWGSNDAFHFVKRPASGDLSIEMLVEDFASPGHDWAKGGIMIRDTLNTNSMHYSMLLTKSGNVLANQWRPCTNCGSQHNSSPDVRDRKLWLRITKIDNVFQAYFRREGDSDPDWIKFGATATINFSSP
eukprot:scaffold139880_cov98-Cyclotella_meneghiniana.AAC.1